MRKQFLLLIAFLITLSCSEKVPVSESKLLKVYTDLMFAQDTILVNSKNIDSLKSVIFSRYEISEEEYTKTLAFYNNNPVRWEKFFEKVINYVEGLKGKQTRASNTSLWPRQYVKVQN